MIPISDINPAKNTPIISRIFMISVVLTYVMIQPKTDLELFNFFYEYAAIPCEFITGYPLSIEQYYQNNCNVISNDVIFPFKNVYLGLFYSNFFHANFIHILGNLWSFWIFGNNVEDKLGKIKFLIFLLIVGAVKYLIPYYFKSKKFNNCCGSFWNCIRTYGCICLLISKC
jgi:membrane associated rhomboid family serine protease